MTYTLPKLGLSASELSAALRHIAPAIRCLLVDR